MFTGIVTHVGEVVAVEERGQGLRRLRVATSIDPATIALGASICHDGVCLTVVATGGEEGRFWHEVDVGAETLARTTAGRWTAGTRLNIERSLKIGDELGGHIVTGHVDGVARVISRDDFEGMARFAFRVQAPLSRFVAEKGSVALSGTSLTVNAVAGHEFSVLLIPHSLAVTTWGGVRAGDDVNIEVDLMARYAARLVEASRT